MAQNPESMVILTDCEPDDLVAFIILRHIARAKGWNVVVVTGEASCNKTAIARAYFPEARVYDGPRSDKDFPEDMFDGIADLTTTDETYVLDPATTGVVVMLRPAPELMECLKLCEQYNLHAPFSVWAYGSFNLRAFRKHGIDSAEFLRLVQTYTSEFVLYESFLVSGETNVFTLEGHPAFYAYLSNEHPHVAIAQRAWNRHLLKDQVNDLWDRFADLKALLVTDDARGEATANLVERMTRGMKVVRSILSSSMQMVVADFGLAAVMYDRYCARFAPTWELVRGVATIKGQYTVFTPDASGTCWMPAPRALGTATGADEPHTVASAVMAALLHAE